MTPENEKHPNVDKLLLDRMTGNSDPETDPLKNMLIGKNGELIRMTAKYLFGVSGKKLKEMVYLGKPYSNPAHSGNTLPDSSNATDNDPNPPTTNIEVERWDIFTQQPSLSPTINSSKTTPTHHPATHGVRTATRRRLSAFASFYDEERFFKTGLNGSRRDQIHPEKKPSSPSRKGKSLFWETE